MPAISLRLAELWRPPKHRPGLALGLLLLPVFAAHAQVSNIKRDHQIVFYPAIAVPLRYSNSWEVRLSGCVYESEHRSAFLALLRAGLGLNNVELTPGENRLFTERARLFMVDHKRGRKVAVQLGTRKFVLNKSDAGGMFSGRVRLTNDEVQALRTEPLPIRAILPQSDPRVFTGELVFFPDYGITVISDIDDTIKITGMDDRSTMLRRTFLEGYQPVPGMAQVYRAWAEREGAQFCYVSAGPWQLFEPLRQFLRSNGFPAGSFSLKSFRWKDETRFSLFEEPDQYKSATISAIVDHFPSRRFVLVGDSGERDPEIYAALVSRHPLQITRVFIRDLDKPAATARRCQELFRDFPGICQVFTDPTEIKETALPGSKAQ